MAGYGKQGYCKLCALESPYTQRQLDQRLGSGWSASRLIAWLAPKGIKVSRDTIYTHKKHIANPRDRLVSAVEKRAAEHGYLPAKVSEDQFLENIISLGNQRIAESPDDVTIAHALKAAQIRAGLSKKGQDINILVNMFTQMPSHVAEMDEMVIEGESREV